MTYERRALRHMGGEKRKSIEAIMYDSGDRWHLRLASWEWAIGGIGKRVRITARYICKREGRLNQLELEQEAGVEG